jgi:aspartate/methionine/tyrosine aminotransferase
MSAERIGTTERPADPRADPGAVIPPPSRLRKLDVRHSPGQLAVDGAPAAPAMDFSHGDVTAFPPVDGALEHFVDGVADGAHTAYTPYRGSPTVRAELAPRVAALVESAVDPDRELIVTPGSQAGLFLALSALVEAGDRVAIVEPDYFANRRIVGYLGARPVGIRLDYTAPDRPAMIDLDQLRDALAAGVRVVCLSNPNNPTGAVYPARMIRDVAELCQDAGAFVVIDQLYCRLVYPGRQFVHLRPLAGMQDRCVTLLGPSKTESLSGFRTGIAVGPTWLIDRMEAILSIMSLRAGGYSQSVLRSWLAEPAGWLEDRIAAHRLIRDRVVDRLTAVEGLFVRPTEGGSYLFPHLPPMTIPPDRLIGELREREGIVVTRGQEFGPGSDDSFRINFSQDAARTVDAVDRMARLIEHHVAGRPSDRDTMRK